LRGLLENLNNIGMLAKKFRLPVKEFLDKKPKILKTAHFYFKYLPKQTVFTRVGVIISKKTEKSAVKRNKIKRIIFDFFRDKESNFKTFGVDVLISPNKKVFGLKKEEVKKTIKKELKLN